MSNSLDTRYGRFELVQELGRGLKSIVYLARDPEIQRPVALKVFNEPVAPSQEFSSRVKKISSLSHLGIAKVFDVCHTESDGALYFVLEYVEGKSLEAVLASETKLSQAEALAFSEELLDALSYAHSNGVFHHNLKPSNLIVTPDRHLKITDFVDVKSGGTAFLAPEQLSGSGDERSDLFSVGVILYLMVSGHRPFQGNTDVTISFKLLNQLPVPVGALDIDLSPELDLVITRLMAKNPSARYQSAAEAKLDIQAVRDGLASTSLGKSLSKSSSTHIDQAGLRTSSNGSSTTRSRALERTPAAHPAPWRLRASVAFAVLLLTTVLAIRTLLEPVAPPPAAISRRLAVPQFAAEKGRVTTSARKTKPRSAPVLSPAVHAVSPTTSKPSVQLISVPVEVRQPFKKYLMSIWVDDRLAFDNQISSEKKKRFLGMGTASADYMTLIQLPPGEHSLRVRIKAVDESFEGNAQLPAMISEISGQKLLVRCDKTRNQLQVELN
jgi:eukaryotic-like serine/threonine-protein kinase